MFDDMSFASRWTLIWTQIIFVTSKLTLVYHTFTTFCFNNLFQCVFTIFHISSLLRCPIFLFVTTTVYLNPGFVLVMS